MAKLNKRPRRAPTERVPVPVAKEPSLGSKKGTEKARHEFKRLWGVSAIKLGADLDRLRLAREHLTSDTTAEQTALILGMPCGYLLDLEALNRRESND